MPKRTSLPSRFAPVEAGGVLGGRDMRTRRRRRRSPRSRTARTSRRRSSSPAGGCRPCGRTCTSATPGSTSIASISRKFVSPFGFSNGNAELTLKNPPPLVPSSLMISCEATGPQSVSDCDDALGGEDQRADERDRQQHVEHRARQVLPEVAEPGRAGAARAIPRIRATATTMPTAAETKFCTASPAIWLKNDERRLAAVVLPVRVRDERRRRVERQVPGARVKAVRVERMQRLRAQDQVEREPEQRREDSSEPA